jgi:hypothetical protein
VQSASSLNPDCECFVVLILNTRRKVKGHYLVSIGTLDTLLVHPREVFKLALMVSAAAIILMHNLCVAAHKLCYVKCGFMWSVLAQGFSGCGRSTVSPSSGFT